MEDSTSSNPALTDPRCSTSCSRSLACHEIFRGPHQGTVCRTFVLLIVLWEDLRVLSPAWPEHKQELLTYQGTFCTFIVSFFGKFCFQIPKWNGFFLGSCPTPPQNLMGIGSDGQTNPERPGQLPQHKLDSTATVERPDSDAASAESDNYCSESLPDWKTLPSRINKAGTGSSSFKRKEEFPTNNPAHWESAVEVLNVVEQHDLGQYLIATVCPLPFPSCLNIIWI